ncbi:putative voltage gated chloride channel domain-containing protein [Neospora caninum Liverpool]|nr:putative voltage gated chloride channel domain-containing protein [Neospora caninum Liverpool]CBZ50903.1 putative voltage gated chloride channel domain-containing protein [Neospora caninum Liverpool]|eukprot:XP_003880936.1 putative voltage gated chloride channel domain-containing protein [Neospora caninum Liverpool]
MHDMSSGPSRHDGAGGGDSVVRESVHSPSSGVVAIESLPSAPLSSPAPAPAPPSASSWSAPLSSVSPIVSARRLSKIPPPLDPQPGQPPSFPAFPSSPFSSASGPSSHESVSSSFRATVSAAGARVRNATRLFLDFLFFALVTVGAVAAAAWLVCALAPKAAGSGIAEVKVLLNGFRSLPHVLSASVLIVKIFGLSLAVGSGLVLGKEGPMVHVACCWAHLLLRIFSPSTNAPPRRKSRFATLPLTALHKGPDASHAHSAFLPPSASTAPSPSPPESPPDSPPESPASSSFFSGGWGVDRSRFRGHLEKSREESVGKPLLAAASAAGMSCAFGSPIAGVLFAFEEMGASDLPGSALWLCCCSCVSASILLEILNAQTAPKDSKSSAGFAFSPFGHGAAHSLWMRDSVDFFHTFEVVELLPFALLGLIGGVLGPVFIWLALRAGQLRKKKLRTEKTRNQEPTRGRTDSRADSEERETAGKERGERETESDEGAEGEGRTFSADREERSFWGEVREKMRDQGPIVDCVLVAACTAFVNFLFPMVGASSSDLLENLFSRCTTTASAHAVDRFGMCASARPPFTPTALASPAPFPSLPVASPSFSFSPPGANPAQPAAFARGSAYRLDSAVLGELFLLLVLKFSLAVATFGLALPAGIFVPALIIGSAYGRLMGLLVLKLNLAYAFMSVNPSPSSYALVGAVSFLCGITRMNLSLVLLMMEISSQAAGSPNSSAFGLPFLLALGIAKGVSSALCSYSLYDGLIVCKNYPYMFHTQEVSFANLRAEDVMERDVVSVAVQERRTLGDLLHLVSKHSFEGFPVILDSETRVVLGYLSMHRLREALEELLRCQHPFIHAHTFVSFSGFSLSSAGTERNARGRRGVFLVYRHRNGHRVHALILPSTGEAERRDKDGSDEDRPQRGKENEARDLPALLLGEAETPETERHLGRAAWFPSVSPVSLSAGTTHAELLPLSAATSRSWDTPTQTPASPAVSLRDGGCVLPSKAAEEGERAVSEGELTREAEANPRANGRPRDAERQERKGHVFCRLPSGGIVGQQLGSRRGREERTHNLHAERKEDIEDVHLDMSGLVDETQPLQLPPETPLIDVYGTFKQLKCSMCLLTRHGRLHGMITKGTFMPYMKFKHFQAD